MCTKYKIYKLYRQSEKREQQESCLVWKHLWWPNDEPDTIITSTSTNAARPRNATISSNVFTFAASAFNKSRCHACYEGRFLLQSPRLSQPTANEISREKHADQLLVALFFVWTQHCIHRFRFSPNHPHRPRQRCAIVARRPLWTVS